MIVKKEHEIIEQYTVDSSNFKGYADAVFIPENENELKELLRISNVAGTSVTFSGAGTGLTGGRVAQGGIVISGEKFDKILNIDMEKQFITVQAAVSNGEIADALEEIGYFIPPNPTERTASIGGNVSTNASGARTYMYGATREYVDSIRVVLANGDTAVLSKNDEVFSGDFIQFTTLEGNIYNIPKPTYSMPDNLKHAAGYYSMPEMQSIDLFIGSEGTLGFISEVTLKFISKPEKVIGFIIFFDSQELVFDFVAHLQNSKINHQVPEFQTTTQANPRLIEYFDSNSLKLLREKYEQIDSSAIAAIWVEQEIISDLEDEIVGNWFELISNYTNLADDTWAALNPSEHIRFREFRHTLPEKVFEIVTRNNQHKVGVDAAVPNACLSKMYELLINTADKYNLDKVIYGHIGNSHLHGNVFFKNENERNNAYLFYDEVIDEVLKMGGTVSAEHGIGKLKVKYLLKMFGNTIIEQMRAVKKSIDPNNILNVGNLFE